MITLTTYEEARLAFRCRDLRQALYDEGHRLMDGVVVNLHGDEHVARRRLENRLFRRDTFSWYERERIPVIVELVLGPAVERGLGDLLPLARRTMLALSTDVAGVDRPSGSDASLDSFYALMDRLARASTVAHATGDKAQIIADGEAALLEFETDHFTPSIARRRRILDRFDRGELDESDLPRDVLTTLLRNQERLELPPATVLREVAYYPWVGSHSTSNQLVHAMHHVFEWLDEHPSSRADLIEDHPMRQRFVHESIRLHPASPVALRRALVDVELGDILVPAGTHVTIDVESANRDARVFGADADEFDPTRPIADDVTPWGLSFGHGTHACLGQELAGGLRPDDVADHHLLGAVAIMVGAMLEAGARVDPDERPTRDLTTTRFVWGRYPVVFR